MSKAFDAAAQQRLLESRATLALELARQQGADACEVGASVDQGIGVSVRDGAVESIELSRDQGIAVTVYLGVPKGGASSTDAGAGSFRWEGGKALAVRDIQGRDPADVLAE